MLELSVLVPPIDCEQPQVVLAVTLLERKRKLSDTTAPSVCAPADHSGMLGLDGMNLFMHQQVLQSFTD